MEYQAVMARVERYYSDKLKAHGPTAQGVDWNSVESQRLRFAELLRLCPADRPFSLNDYGCGYGALVDEMSARGLPFQYTGYDISRDMIARAVADHQGRTDCEFTSEASHLKVADYSVASGIFNVKVETADDEWTPYVFATIDRLAAVSELGFAFNMLTTNCDRDRRQSRLFYADPLRIFEYCRTTFSRHVALLHDYPLYEFTILVRLQPK